MKTLFKSEILGRNLSQYTMKRYTVVAPSFKNDGTVSRYEDLMRDCLMNAGITGWTEYQTKGFWNGKCENGVTFEIYSELDILQKLCNLARMIMHDQEAIQVTVDSCNTQLIEA